MGGLGAYSSSPLSKMPLVVHDSTNLRSSDRAGSIDPRSRFARRKSGRIDHFLISRNSGLNQT